LNDLTSPAALSRMIPSLLAGRLAWRVKPQSAVHSGHLSEMEYRYIPFLDFDFLKRQSSFPPFHIGVIVKRRPLMEH
jgi:hypothetical protein